MHRFTLAFSTAIVALSCTPIHPIMVPVARYPQMLRSVAAAGDVPVRVTVGRSGEVKAIRVDTQFTASPVGRELLAVVIQRALREARFVPARQFGVARDGETDFVYRFALTRPTTPLDANEMPGTTDSLPVNCPSSSSTRIIVVCVPAYPTRARVLY